MKFCWTQLILCIVLIIYILVRFNNISNRIRFAWDEERDAFQIHDIIKNGKLTLLGPRVVGVSGFFLAPYHTYLLAPFYLISNLNPLVIIVFVSVYNLVFFFVSKIIITKKWSNKHTTLFLLFWALNPLLISSDITAWNVLLIPLGILLQIYLLILIQDSPTTKKWLALGLLNGIMINLHFQFIFPILFSTIFLLKIVNISRSYLKGVFFSFLGFLLTLLPLLIFDLRHNFLNLNLFANFFFSKTSSSLSVNFDWLSSFSNSLKSLTIFSSIVTTALFLLVFLFVVFFVYKHSFGYMKRIYFSIGVMILFTSIFFSIYSQQTPEYYYIFLFPYIYLVLVEFFLIHKAEYFLVFFILLSSILNHDLQRALAPSADSVGYKIQVVEYIQDKYHKKRFNISLNTDPGRNSGYYYLINYYKLTTDSSPDNPLIEIVIPPSRDAINDEILGVGLKVPEELRLQ